MLFELFRVPKSALDFEQSPFLRNPKELKAAVVFTLCGVLVTEACNCNSEALK